MRHSLAQRRLHLKGSMLCISSMLKLIVLICHHVIALSINKSSKNNIHSFEDFPKQCFIIKMSFILEIDLAFVHSGTKSTSLWHQCAWNGWFSSHPSQNCQQTNGVWHFQLYVLSFCNNSLSIFTFWNCYTTHSK